MSLPLIPDHKNLNKSYLDLLLAIDYRSLARQDATKWAKVYYQLGLIAYSNGDLNLIPHFWKASTHLAPEWSYFHVELANFYLSQGNKDGATEAINFCLRFFFPKEHCMQFLEQNIKIDSSLPLGSWKDDISKI